MELFAHTLLLFTHTYVYIILPLLEASPIHPQFINNIHTCKYIYSSCEYQTINIDFNLEIIKISNNIKSTTTFKN